jgi:hypothetical protein
VALCCVAFACGGETADANSNAHASGGSPASGGSTSGGAAATGGYAGCANRSVVYDSDTVFPSENHGINALPECTPTCGQSYNSIQSIPAGPCNDDPTCVMMMARLVTLYFRCECVDGQWSCASVSGAP